MSNRPWVNYHHLLYFKTIAQEGGIAKAAKKLRLGQPTLSTQLKQFEEVLGHELFDRSKRQLQLTDAGKMVLGYATEIFKIGDEMVDSLNDHHVASKIQIQIGITDSVPKNLAYKVFQKAKATADCIVTIVSGHGDELLRELRAHRVDLVVSNFLPPANEFSGFYSKSIAKMPVSVCGTSKFAKLKSNFPSSLEGQPVIMPHRLSKLRSDIEHFLKLNDIKIDLVGEIQDTSLQKSICIHGDSLICIATQAVAELVKNKEFVVIGTLPDIMDELWLISAERKLQNPVAAKIMKEFKLT
jgi:LysR family transcriptional regulator, transcriptional activator of nhaA